MRLIDADDFLDSFYVASAGQDKEFIKAVEMVVEDAPTIDAEPVRRGRWELVHKELAECSACEMIRNIRTQFAWAYCPYCGAKMQGNNDEAL